MIFPFSRYDRCLTIFCKILMVPSWILMMCFYIPLHDNCFLKIICLNHYSLFPVTKMLSRKEREYILKPDSFNPHYASQLRYAMKKKISATVQDLNLIIEHSQRLGIQIDSLKNIMISSIIEPNKQPEKPLQIDDDAVW